jgi:hypothetical protein
VTAADHDEIAAVVDRFFAAFVSGPDAAARLDGLRAVLLPAAVIVRTCGAEPTVYDVEGFIAPRADLLASGTMTGFREWVLDGRTDVWGDIAQRWCRYAKSWTQDGIAHEGRGMKSVQLVRTGAGWRISGAVWDDDRPGLTWPARA